MLPVPKESIESEGKKHRHTVVQFHLALLPQLLDASNQPWLAGPSQFSQLSSLNLHSVSVAQPPSVSGTACGCSA